MAINFVKMHRHTGGRLKGDLFDLQPAQAFVIASLFGWRVEETGLRRFTNSYHSMARKGGKTELAGAIGNTAWLLEEFGSAEFYTAATKIDQARITYNVCLKQLKGLARDVDEIRNVLNFRQFEVRHEGFEGFLKALPAEPSKLDGLRPYVSIIDEYHAHKRALLYDVLNTGGGHTESPLFHITTTAGYNIAGPCYQERKLGIEIIKGIKDDDSMFFMDHTLDEGDDWNNEELWGKPNPNIGRAPFRSYLIKQHRKAVNAGGIKEVEFKTKNLNVWTSTGITWIQDEVWQDNSSGEWDAFKELRGRECYGGLDLASTKDITALVLFFPSDGRDKHRIVCFTWTPEDTIRERSHTDGVDYLKWMQDKWMRSTPGNRVDQPTITKEVIDLKDKYRFDIKDIGCDDWNASQVMSDLNAAGVKCTIHGQQFSHMSEPTKLVDVLANNKELDHGNNPVLRWALSNVMLAIDPSDRVKIDKKKSSDKVDPAVALVMAVSTWLYHRQNTVDSVYNSRGIRTI